MPLFLRPVFCLVLVLGLSLNAAPALAHKVSLFAYVEGKAIKGEGYFAGGEKAKDCPVVLQDAQGRELGSTRTDQRGEFSLSLPSAPPPWRLVMAAGQGHQAAYTLGQEEAGGEAQPGQEAAAPADAPAGQMSVASPAQMEELVRVAVEKGLEPIKAQMARQAAEQSFGLRDIVGGVGYILGLMGLAAYLKRRKG